MSLGFSLTSLASADAVRFTAGHGYDTYIAGIGVEFDPFSLKHQFKRWEISGHVEVMAEDLLGQRVTTLHNTVQAKAGIATLRWQRGCDASVVPFFDVGVGAGRVSRLIYNFDRNLASHFQFTEVGRAGIKFGTHKQFDVAVFVQHYSNAGITLPNDSLTFGGISAAWYWR